MKGQEQKKVNQVVLALLCLVFLAMITLARLPRSPQPSPQYHPVLRKAAGELSSKYWLFLLVSGLAATWYQRRLLFRIVLVLVANQIVVEMLKVLVSEMRPDGQSFDSFPSGHAAACFAFATVMEQHLPRWGWWWFAFAGLVSVSRIIVHAHWWHDVIGGAALGCLIAISGQYLWQRCKDNGSSCSL